MSPLCLRLSQTCGLPSCWIAMSSLLSYAEREAPPCGSMLLTFTEHLLRACPVLELEVQKSTKHVPSLLRDGSEGTHVLCHDAEWQLCSGSGLRLGSAEVFHLQSEGEAYQFNETSSPFWSDSLLGERNHLTGRWGSGVGTTGGGQGSPLTALGCGDCPSLRSLMKAPWRCLSRDEGTDGSAENPKRLYGGGVWVWSSEMTKACQRNRPGAGACGRKCLMKPANVRVRCGLSIGEGWRGRGVARGPRCGWRRGEACERPWVLLGLVLWTPWMRHRSAFSWQKGALGVADNETFPAVRMWSTSGSVKGQVIFKHVRQVGHSEPVTTPRLCHHGWYINERTGVAVSQ